LKSCIKFQPLIKIQCVPESELKNSAERRSFIGALAAIGGTFGLSLLVAPLTLRAQKQKPEQKHDTVTFPADKWFRKLKGEHRVVFDATRPNGIMPFAWPRIFLVTNAATGSRESDCGVVVVLRHHAIPYAFENRLWEKYKFGERFKADDPLTKQRSTRNPFWKPRPGDYKIPGTGNVDIGINDLQTSGVLFCVCDAAITMNSAEIAASLKKDAAEIKTDWLAGLLPGIQVVPSGVWALERTQDLGCGYIFAG